MRRERLAYCMMILAMALQWGTSYITSEQHVCNYHHYMKTYLEMLKDIFPGLNIWPNHHAALHLDTFLCRYGPLHGWWMFPFKRIIGSLQQKNTNHKIGETSLTPIICRLTCEKGELEKTMLISFCAVARVQTILQHPDAPSCIWMANEIVRQCHGAQENLNISKSPENWTQWKLHSLGKQEIIGPKLKKAFSLIGIKVDDQMTINVFLCVSKGWQMYTNRALMWTDCYVFWEKTEGSLVPGIIKQIFTVGNQQSCFVAIHKKPTNSWG